MNTELKALISSLFDGEKLVTDAIQKNYIGLITDAMAVVSDVPGDISGWSDLQAEISALSQAANQSNLVSFVQQKFSSIQILNSAQAQAKVAAIVAFISAGIEVEQAFVAS